MYAHHDDAPLIEGEKAAQEDLRQRQEAYFEAWGMPHEKRAALRDRLAGGGDPDY